MMTEFCKCFMGQQSHQICETQVNQCFEKRNGSQTVGSLTIQPPDMAANPRKLYSYACIFTHRHLTYPEQAYLPIVACGLE